MPRDGSITVADLPARGLDRLRVACTRCERQGSYGLAHALDRWGDAKLTNLLHDLTGDCRARKQAPAHDRCGAYYPDLARRQDRRTEPA